MHEISQNPEDDGFVDVYLVGVTPRSVPKDGPQRALDARYVGELIFDAWFDTNVAKSLRPGVSFADEDVTIMAEVVRDESAVLTLSDNQLIYPEKLTDRALQASVARLEFEITRRWKKRVASEGEE